MKILLVHNFYGSSAPSGESQVFEAEKALLRKHGHEIEEFTRHSDDIRSQGVLGKIKGAFSTPWNPWMAHAIRRKVKQFKPDVVHVHNTFPLISPAIFHAIGHRAARVITLHNYRLLCPAAIPMRGGSVCTECLDTRSAWPSIQHGCYRNSRIATLPLAANVALHRLLGTWTNQVEAFIALSEFQRELMVKSGLPDGKTFVKPNYYPGMPKIIKWDNRENYVVFAGRLSIEKGVEHLLKAWRAWGKDAPELRLVGEGDLKPQLERLTMGLKVRFMGQMNSVETQAQIAGARLLILPSVWFEGFPMVVREAFAFGTPAAVSDIGPLPFIVQHGTNGLVFKTANSESILEVVRGAWTTPDLFKRLSLGARMAFEEKYTEDANYRIMMQIYQSAIRLSKNLRSMEME